MDNLKKNLLDIDNKEQNKKIITVEKKNSLNNLEEQIKNISLQKPFLKWVGGKTQIITDILKFFPLKIDTYHEIFLGGGSVLFGVLSLIENNIINIKKIYAYDLNKPLIYLYKNIQNNCDNFIKEIKKIVNEYNNITGNIINRKPKNINEAKTSQESYYYWIRKEYNLLDENNKLSIIGSAYFLFLNKTCFRGLYRIGPNGFNVPYGHYNKPTIYEKENLKIISELIKNVNFIHSSFEQSLLNIKKKDLIYCDPPYVPINASSFVSYTADGFEGILHKKLFKLLHELKDKNIKWIMSNSDTKLVIDSFSDNDKFITQKILCRRAINSKKPDSKTNEVIIKSF
jgi:DNA adenine methylase